MCGKEVKIDQTANIDFRPHYIEGTGQCCRECYNKVYGKETIHDICTEPVQKKNIAKEVILGVYVLIGMLFLCGSVDSANEAYAWLYFGAFLAYVGLGYIIFRNSNFNNKA